MKVYLALSNPRILDLIQSAIRMHWHDVEIQSAVQYRFIVPDISRGEHNLAIVSADYAYADHIDRVAGIHSVSDIPLIIISERDDDLFESHALDAGADAVLVCPVSPLRLVSTIRAILRRVDAMDIAGFGDRFAAGQLVIDYQRREVFMCARRVSLTPTEYRLLYLFSKNAGRVLTHRTLIERVWGQDTLATADHLKVNISRLRAKLRTTEQPSVIEGVRGVGYRLDVPLVGPGEGLDA